MISITMFGFLLVHSLKNHSSAHSKSPGVWLLTAVSERDLGHGLCTQDFSA